MNLLISVSKVYILIINILYKTANGYLLYPWRRVNVPQGFRHFLQEQAVWSASWQVQCFPETKPAKGKAEAHFSLVNYAGNCGLQRYWLVDKNKDPLNESVLQLYQKSSVKLLATIYPPVVEGKEKLKCYLNCVNLITKHLFNVALSSGYYLCVFLCLFICLETGGGTKGGKKKGGFHADCIFSV